MATKGIKRMRKRFIMSRAFDCGVFSIVSFLAARRNGKKASLSLKIFFAEFKLYHKNP